LTVRGTFPMFRAKDAADSALILNRMGG